MHFFISVCILRCFLLIVIAPLFLYKSWIKTVNLLTCSYCLYCKHCKFWRLTVDIVSNFFKFFVFQRNYFFLASILGAMHCIDICIVKIENIRNMDTNMDNILTNQITDVWHFSDRINKVTIKDYLILLYINLSKNFH